MTRLIDEMKKSECRSNREQFCDATGNIFYYYRRVRRFASKANATNREPIRRPDEIQLSPTVNPGDTQAGGSFINATYRVAGRGRGRLGALTTPIEQVFSLATEHRLEPRIEQVSF